MIADTAALLLSVAAIGLGVRFHEPWADEAHAWQIAKSLSFLGILGHGVRYEGTPALWHCFLHLLVVLHIGYTGMRWVAGLVAAGGVAIFLRWSPFPWILRLLIPLTFWIAYQDAAVARSYILFTPLGFGIAALLRQRVRRPWLAAIVIGLIANISIHGFIAALGLAGVAAVLWRRARRLAGSEAERLRPRAAGVSAAVLCACLFGVAVYSAFPPMDVNFGAGRNVMQSWNRVEAKIQGRKLPKASETDWRPGELQPLDEPVHHRTPLESLHEKSARFLAAISYPLSTVGWWGLAVFVAVCVLGLRTRGMEQQGAVKPGPLGAIGLLPYLLVTLVFLSMYLAPRHCGMLMMCFLIAAWLVWPATSEPLTRWQKIVTAMLIVMAGEQIAWTAHAVWSDVWQQSAPGAETARFLKEHPGAKVDGFYYHAEGVLPYFGQNIYANQKGEPYWLWKKDVRIVQNAPAELAEHPDILVVGGWSFSPRNGEVEFDWTKPDADLNKIPNNDVYQVVPYAEAHGYRETHRFCGEQFMRFGYSEKLCDLVLQRVGE